MIKSKEKAQGFADYLEDCQRALEGEEANVCS